jgi:YD repeat-containing protein
MQRDASDADRHLRPKIDHVIARALGGSDTFENTAASTYSYTSGTNRLASLTDSSGTRSISYDARGDTSAETRPGSVAVSTSYDAYGRLTG